SHTAFGLDHDNYIGSLHQWNKQAPVWTEFYIQQRLEPQIKLATDNRLPIESIKKRMAAFCRELAGAMPEEPPALLHGDLWSGNLITDDQGDPCLIDPAVYYGHREAELAFAKLMSNFDERFYRAYNDAFP